MPIHRHEIPTHLSVEDRAFYGLSVRQATYLILGTSWAYGLWSQLPDLSPGIRLILAIACVTLAIALALLRPLGRPMEEWLFVALRYLAVPKSAIWRCGGFASDPETPPLERWHELEPRVIWKGGR